MIAIVLIASFSLKAQNQIEGKVLDEMNIHKYCCRRMMISNVHMISYISYPPIIKYNNFVCSYNC